ncbi:MAG: SpoIID/LytB domain-containing protein [Elusimicrobiota bacterium]
MVFFLFLASLLYAGPLEQGHALYFEGRFDEALKSYQEAESSGPLRADALRHQALVHRDLGDMEASVAALRQALKLEPEDADTLETLAWFYYLAGRDRRARSCAKKRLEMSESALSLYILGAAWSGRAGKGAEEALLRLAKLQPSSVLADMALGRVYESWGRLKDARASYEAALRHDYTYTEARVPLAAVLERLGDPAAAFAQWAEVRKVDSRHPGLAPLAAALQAKAETESQARSEEFVRTAPAQRLRGAAPAERREAMPRVRVGLGVTPGGNPLRLSGVLFVAGGPFRILEKKRSHVVAEGQGREVWRVEVSSQELRIYSPDSRLAASVTEPVRLRTVLATHTVMLHDVRHGQGFSWAGAGDREYRDTLELIPDPSVGLILVNELPLDEYLYSVLPSEMPGSDPEEALKAQAVVARTHTLYRMKTVPAHKGRPYDLCDSQHCQVYSGLGVESSKVRAAVDETRGIVLTHDGKPIQALFQANCGGHTQTAADLPGWVGQPYLQAVPEADTWTVRSPWQVELWLKGSPPAYCAASRYVTRSSFRWAWPIPAAELEERVERRSNVGRLKRVFPARRSSSGFVLGLGFAGESGETVVTKEHEIRRLMAVGQVRSPLFVIEAHQDRKAGLDRFYMFGGGWGHGVGMCQGGAANLASEKGWPYDRILRHYYTGVSTETLGY